MDNDTGENLNNDICEQSEMTNIKLQSDYDQLAILNCELLTKLDEQYEQNKTLTKRLYELKEKDITNN